MELPKVLTEFKDSGKNFTLKIYAYRKVTRAEARQALALWLRNSKRKTIPCNYTGEVITIFGYDE